MATALITGASAGLGLEFAWQLATARHDLVLVARNTERLEVLAADLRSVAGVRVEVLPADLATQQGQDDVIARLTQDERPIGLLVNNAGYTLQETFLDSTREAQQAALAVMVQAVMVLSHTAAQHMTQRGRGAILNVSSVAAFLTGPYSAHKAWVRTFTEGLAVELHGTGVTATVLCPGLVHTEFHERAHLDYTAVPEYAWLNAADVVRAALLDVRRGVVISTPSLRYRAASGLLRALPRFIVRNLRGSDARQKPTPQ
ncbi:SDR family NAD(P)-dependent oxidoreductase [Timonella sp. A28]|uniref:SDR family NAD(P)-dependent oxidoreductase n=1 Tax=Timonella sp. A28 TaxID=3442640 RepID=UPI003EBC63FD